MPTTTDPLLDEATALAARAPEPAAVGNVLFGTAGWTDPSLVKGGLFYPKGVRTAQTRLEHYSRHFPLVEVDATYYSLLPPEVAERWVSFTPETFVFDVKAHPVFTGHPIDVARLPADLKGALAAGTEETPARIYPDALPGEIRAELETRFLAFLSPLLAAGRLGAVLLQFPPWFGATRGNARRIEAAVRRLPGVQTSVEFRNKSWFEDGREVRTLDLVRGVGAAYVVVDEPSGVTGGVPPLSAVTNPALAIVRFHGQNSAGWRPGASVAERFDYLYRDSELSGWVAPVRAIADRVERVHAVFNNCVRNNAILNAKGLSALLHQDLREGA